MYLTRFVKEGGVGPDNWGQDRESFDYEEMDAKLEELDATLNSWEEAHWLFHTYQGDEKQIQVSAYLRFVALTRQVWMGSSQYVLEALTYALLERWIEVRQADIAMGN